MATVLGTVTQQYTCSLNNVMTKHGMGYKLVSEAHKENMSHYTDKQCYGQGRINYTVYRNNLASK